MSLWKDNAVAKPAAAPAPASYDFKESARAAEPPPARPEPVTAAAPAPAPRPAAAAVAKESIIASDLTIEGKIEGGGSVRIAGKFKGDVNVQGDLTIEAGAKLTGSVRADKVTIAGELEGNVDSASRVDLLQTGIVVGDLKARSLAVAAGATMRGRAEFGGEDGEGPKAGRGAGNGSTGGAHRA